MKKILNKLPGGENKLKSLVAALFLVKEYYQSGSRSTALMEEKFDKVLKMLENRVSLVEEEIIVTKFLKEEAPVNSTAGASVSEHVIKKKDIKKYQVMARRKPVNVSA